ncbi:MAG: hypothetical protein A3I66_04800 [Burkholderiales bacterium RIFCSPLOWO2_02_FULL_57_36]|nr:MAG: hypothetical protein A3I66_04800 [Burkholderiales bacterium RIFCSPLOWO2_02_FULL_57_36]
MLHAVHDIKRRHGCKARNPPVNILLLFNRNGEESRDVITTVLADEEYLVATATCSWQDT